ncbi:MAG: adenylate/guanylate cyclase domain-containing protein [Desulfobacterales bacterium]|nr:adenylate/guanylate cyclase domain-containing protein [Desulfobacterales bacterium]
MIPSELHGQKIYLGQYADITGPVDEGEIPGTLILKTINVRGEPVCEAGIIMGGPYFLIHYSCQELAVTRKLNGLKCLFFGRNKLLEEFFKVNDTLRIEIDEKNKACEKIKEYADHLEEMVQKRTVELSEAQVKLIEADKLKSNFFANVSHEVRTPLTLLISPIESILNGDFSGSIDDNFFKGLHRNAVRLLELINSMLDFSKIEAGQMSMKITPVEVVQMIKNWIGTIHSACEMRYINLSFISLNKSVELWLDINKFEKIVMNLFSNCLKFTEQGGQIVVRIKDDDKNCYFELEDTGFGIPHDKIDSIFDRFCQVDSNSSYKHEGTGIGLALVKEYVEMHGGCISVESKCKEENMHDHGTIFHITIPKGKEHFEGKQGVVFVDKVLDESISDSWLIRMRSLKDIPAESNDAAEPQASISKLEGLPNILVVEDNLEMRNYLKMLLKNNYNINIAVNGQEGLNLANQLQPDLIITDVMMPIMNGYEMTRLIKTDDNLKRIPIIMITAKSELANKIEGLEYGADDYLTKPFNSKELLVRVKNLLQLSSLQQELIYLNESLQDKVKEQIDKITKRDKLKGYLPPQLVDSILNGSSAVSFANERKKLTIFFSDIQGFTTATENLEAEDLSRILNEYFTVMTNIAHKWGGTVDKFIGDGIMIIFGAPAVTDEKDHALRCVKMAIEMQLSMKQLQEKWFQSGLEFCPLIRIGINTGIATVGNFGTEDRLSYTAVGGQVNLASRLESICEPGGILISHSTWALAKDEIGYKNERTVEVKGIHRKVLVYDVVW